MIVLGFNMGSITSLRLAVSSTISLNRSFQRQTVRSPILNTVPRLKENEVPVETR